MYRIRHFNASLMPVRTLEFYNNNKIMSITYTTRAHTELYTRVSACECLRVCVLDSLVDTQKIITLYLIMDIYVKKAMKPILNKMDKKGIEFILVKIHYFLQKWCIFFYLKIYSF